MFTFFGSLNYVDAYNNQDYNSNRTNWPCLRGNLANTGASSTSNAPRTNNTLWKFSCGQGFGTPAISNGVIFIGSEYGNLRALNFSTGEELWKTHFNGGATTPAIEDGVLYVGGTGEAHAVNATTGKVLWTFTRGNFDVYYPPAVKDGFVYFACILERCVYALNASNGNKIWNFTTELALESSPAVANGIVYVGSVDGYVYALAAVTGGLVWKHQVDWYFILTSSAVSQGILYAGSSYFFKFSALNASTGNIVWSVTMKDRIWSSPCVANGKVFFGTNDGNYYALNATTGKMLWNYTVEGNGENQYSPAIAGGILYVCSHDGVVYALNAETGAKIWSYDTNWISPQGAPALTSPVIANGVVIVGSGKGILYAFGSAPAPAPTHDS
jgi:outer membrane protein assembly factor BamB